MVSAAILGTACSRVPSGEKTIHAMYEKWNGTWPQNMAFEQAVYHYQHDSVVKEEIWQEILSCPSNLHIRFNGFENGNGLIFRNDSIFHFTGGELTKSERRIHHLLLLAFDVYFLQPYETIAKLKELGFNLSEVSTSKTDGRDMIVVGTTNPQDSTKSQFWIDKEYRYLRKVILNNNGRVSEVLMDKYVTIENNPVAIEITFKTNHKVTMVERYFNISLPSKVQVDLFDPKQFWSSRW
jgi:hypothetical protein